MYALAQIPSLNDAVLDDEYYNEFVSGRQTKTYANAIAQEIHGRLAGVFSFVSGSVGYTRFPKFEKCFNAVIDSQVSNAQGSIQASAQNVATNIGNFVGGAVGSGIGAGVNSIPTSVKIIAVLLLLLMVKG
jgi:predicted MFS family arabinose efflux permease